MGLEVDGDVARARERAEIVDIEAAVLDLVTASTGRPDARSAADRADPDGMVRLHPGWRAELLLPTSLRTGLAIGPEDLAEAAAKGRASGDWLPLLVLANAAGFGESSFGAWRTARTVAIPDARSRLGGAVAVLDDQGPVAAYYLLNNEGHLRGWGPSHFTRFLAAADRSGEAIVLDPGVAQALNALLPVARLAPADWPTADYAFALTVVHRLAVATRLDPVRINRELAVRGRLVSATGSRPAP